MRLIYVGIKGDLQVFPNPARAGLVTIRNPGATEKTWLSVQSSSGKELMRMLMPEKEMSFPASVLPAGIYIIKVWNDLELNQTRLMIQ